MAKRTIATSAPVNLASLPKDQALALARSGGRSILGDIDAVTHVYTELMQYWVDRNVPNAVGQSDDEFGDVLQQIENDFNGGVDEAVASVKAASPGDRQIALGDVSAVAFRCEQSFHTITALYELCQEEISNAKPGESVHTFVVFREALRGLARDMENCADLLQPDCGQLGYFAAAYGKV